MIFFPLLPHRKWLMYPDSMYMYTFYDLTPRCRLDLSFVFLFIQPVAKIYLRFREKFIRATKFSPQITK